MAIDISTETVVSLTEATRQLPKRRAGKRPNVATLYRWTNDGCRGVRLEYVMVGGTRCTSLDALQRFFDALTSVAESERPAAISVAPALTKSRQRQIEAAEKRLARAGV
jgi:hypothetical protein